ncbi:LamG-like jellyroll fold domain-containing protein [Streptomyces olivochromogenes]|uniref:LamG-like jellyroll fold domain-containing protein n=1 Tax=Streptomyces olivochromogenes TaxID=1963 RepID=UPI0027E4FF42|nr:LamG-like jellyroll fold domain-containing protein [Streptomyces olivochromogenes]MCF3129504.1 ricin-type beta-trefoil lectin domain protein [Streptomyces olivochromogenes]
MLPSSVRRLALLPAVATLLLTGLVVPAAGFTADDPVDTSDPLLAAQAQAVAEGASVPVDALTSETDTVTAEPDGSFTRTSSVLPVRVRQDDNWVPVDATITANADGTYSPKATLSRVRLSGGGNGPLATLTDPAGHRMSLTMPFALPAPQVAGNTALYGSVLPGVDLSVSVTDQGGFSDVLVVHDAKAAADPRVRRLAVATDTDGLDLAPTASGGMTATAPDGSVSYTSPPPLMWDSSGSSPTGARARLRTTSLARAAAGSPDPTDTSSVTGPGTGAQVGQVPMSTASGTITLAPDTSLLDGPGTHYPVYIDPFEDPVTSKSGAFDEVYSSSACSDAPQYNKPQTNGEGVGYQRWGGACGTGLERSYYAVNTSGLDPSMKVIKAEVKVKTTYAASLDCSHDQPITLHTTGGINENTDWKHQPDTLDDNGYPAVKTTVPSGANTNCSNSTAGFRVDKQIQKIADGNKGTWTIGLFGNETTSSSNDDYLRMSQTLSLFTNFDIPPDTPTKLHTTPKPLGADGDCVTGSGAVGWIGATTYDDAGSNVQLHSTVITHIKGEHAQAHYHVWDRTDLDSSGSPVDKPDRVSDWTASGGDADASIGFTLKDGHEYGWDVYAQDNSSIHMQSPVSDHCWFDTDFTPPQTPAIADNPHFPSVGSGAGDTYAGSGVTTDFSVTAADNTPADTCDPAGCKSSGIERFLWQLDSQPTAATGHSAKVTSTSGTTASGTLTVPVTDWGVHTLYVAAVDRAGNISQSPAGYTFAAPWNPKTKIAPGDITGDGSPDLLATTSTGDLELIPGNSDPAQAPAPAQGGPVTGTPPAITGPVIVSTAAAAPAGTWSDYLIAHRGNLHGDTHDDLLAYNRKSNKLYVVKNDLDPKDDGAFPHEPFSTFPGFLGHRYDVVTKDPCESADTVPASRCADAGYDPSTPWDISQLVAAGDVYGNSDHPAVITVEHGKLWIYQTYGTGHMGHPRLLGDGDWSGLTLIAPGRVGGTFTVDANGNGKVTGGTPTLWARDDASGTVYTFPLDSDGNGQMPKLLHAPVRTALASAVRPAGGGTICLDDASAHTADHTKIQVYTCNGSAAQKWVLHDDDSLRVLGKCLDVTDGATDNGALIQLYTCNGSAAQKWTTGASGSLVNPQSGKCLDDPGSSTANGTQVRLYTCNNSAAQNWTSSAATGWSTYTATALPMVLRAHDSPTVASPGDVNSPTGGPDGKPDLYATNTAGQLTEYPGATPTGTTAAFADPVGLGTVTDTAAHRWTLDDAKGSTAGDAAGNLPATLTGGASWATDTDRGTTLNLNGSTGYAATTDPGVDTSGSFTVSAWVKLNSLSGDNSTFVSQSDAPSVGAANGFQLYYSSGAQVWAFGRHDDDTASTSFTAAYGAKAVAGKWTHLVGVYDADASRLLLYVNGRLSAAKAYTGTMWNAAGPVQFGRCLHQSVYGQYANGRLSDVRLYATALSPADAAAPGDSATLLQLD